MQGAHRAGRYAQQQLLLAGGHEHDLFALAHARRADNAQRAGRVRPQAIDPSQQQNHRKQTHKDQQQRTQHLGQISDAEQLRQRLGAGRPRRRLGERAQRAQQQGDK